MKWERFYLLVSPGVTPGKAIAIERTLETTGDDFGRLYDAFDQYLEIPKDRSWAYCASIYEDQTTPQGIPFTYDLCCDGGLYTLWHFEQPKEVLEQAENYLRRSFDVVKLYIEPVILVDWVPPPPFQAIALPDWIAKKPEVEQVAP